MNKEIINRLSEREKRQFKTVYLERVEHRLNTADCERCFYLKEDFNKALDILKAEDRQTKKEVYDKIMKSIIRHLREEHNLYLDTHYRDKYISLGILSSIMVGIWFFDNLPVMLSIMIIILILFGSIGYIKDKKNQNKI